MTNVLVLLDGQALTGQVMHKNFKVTTDIGTLTIPASRIAFIHCERGNPSGVDEVVLHSTTVVRGDLQPDPIKFKLDDTGETLAISQAKIHTLIMFKE
jgi:hypothetical protein